MDKHEAQSALQDININEFARRSGVPLRTLWRLKAGHGEPNKGTLALLSQALKKYKPKKVTHG